MPRISVVVPAYNAAGAIEACVAALRAQEGVEAPEVLVVDDGSTDATAEGARAAGARVIVQSNRGPAAARNHGAREAAGEVLVFTDADCRPLRGFLAALAGPVLEGRADAAKGAYVTEERGLAPRWAQAEFEERYRKLARREAIDFVDTYAMAIRRELFIALGGFDEAFPVANNEDTEFSYRLASRGHKIVFVPEARVAHRHWPTIGRYLALKASRGWWRMEVYRRFPGKALADSYTPQSLKLQILLAPAIPVAAAAAAIWPPAGWAAAGLALLFVVSCAPLAAANLRRDPLVALLSPAYCWLRALAFAWGIGRWLVRARR